MNECHICGGKLKEQMVHVCACEELPSVIVVNVPALVCERCENRVLSQEVINAFDRIRKGDAPAPSWVRSKLFDYQHVVDYKPVANRQAILKRDTLPTGTTHITSGSRVWGQLVEV